MIKTQEDVKKDVRSKKKSVTEKLLNKPLPVQDHKLTPHEKPIINGVSDIMDIFEERISNIELYFESISSDLESLEYLSNQSVLVNHELKLLHAQLENLANNMVGFAELEDNRYNELANMITDLNNMVIKLDQLVPSFVDERINEHMKDVSKIKVGGEPMQ